MGRVAGKRKFLGLGLVLGLSFLFAVPVSASGNGPGTPAAGQTSLESEPQEPTEPTEQPEGEQTSVHFLAVGDDLISETLNNEAYREGGGRTYDYSYIFDPLRDKIQSYDLAAINQETILIGDYSKHSGYPTFGTPDTVASAIVDAGFDIVTQATNHSMDKGLAGISHTIAVWQQYPQVTLLGLHASQESYDSIDYLTKNGITFALFDYTYGLNGFTLPSGHGYAVNLLTHTDKLLSDVAAAESQADFTICFIHMGDEYHYQPNNSQKILATQLIDAGADLIIGAHPHCIEPCEVMTTANGQTGLVYYSLGNFVSSQTNATTILEGAADVTITKAGDVTAITDYEYVPLVNSWVGSKTQPYLLSDYTDAMAANHHFNSLGKPVSVSGLKSTWEQVTGLPAD